MEVRFRCGDAALDADVEHPPGATGVVVFAHGSGSSRRSPRNILVAQRLQGAGFTTVLCDLLTADEQVVDARDGSLRFDIGLLGDRLTKLAEEVAAGHASAALPLGLFGASTGAAAALLAAVARPRIVQSVVSRGGRPDLAGDVLPQVQAPTLLIVGERDPQVLELNRAAAARMACEHEVTVVAGATHLFEEPGALDDVAARAARWFTRTLGSSR